MSPSLIKLELHPYALQLVICMDPGLAHWQNEAKNKQDGPIKKN